ncbi:hypothetical protein ACIBH1_37905 [Nonomuraea sp. NPDC050663]|uniref:hypothetical protein n=1 Tax=Nonomuraea sp. NPDC050663 TaxID=3364370 RepID=UPI0037AE1714
MANRLVEIHVPLVPREGVPKSEYQFPWIDEIEEFLAELEESDEVEVFDDGEEWGGIYIFFITGADEAALLGAASKVGKLDGVPPGIYAMVTDDEAEEFGLGRRVGLPLSD